MLAVLEQFAQIAKTNTERGLRCATISFEGAERLFKVQADATISAFEEGNKSIKAILRSEGDFSKAFSRWPNIYETNIRRTLDISRNFVEVAAQTQSELTQLIDESITGYAKAATEGIEALGKAAESPLSLTKSAAARAGAVDIEAAAKKVKERG